MWNFQGIILIWIKTFSKSELKNFSKGDFQICKCSFKTFLFCPDIFYFHKMVTYLTEWHVVCLLKLRLLYNRVKNCAFMSVFNRSRLHKATDTDGIMSQKQSFTGNLKNFTKSKFIVQQKYRLQDSFLVVGDPNYCSKVIVNIFCCSIVIAKFPCCLLLLIVSQTVCRLILD